MFKPESGEYFWKICFFGHFISTGNYSANQIDLRIRYQSLGLKEGIHNKSLHSHQHFANIGFDIVQCDLQITIKTVRILERILYSSTVVVSSPLNDATSTGVT